MIPFTRYHRRVGLPQIVQGVLKKENHEMVGNAASTLVKMLPLLPYIATFLVNTDAMAVLVEAMIGAEDQTVRLTCAKLIVKLITANDLLVVTSRDYYRV